LSPSFGISESNYYVIASQKEITDRKTILKNSATGLKLGFKLSKEYNIYNTPLEIGVNPYCSLEIFNKLWGNLNSSFPNIIKFGLSTNFSFWGYCEVLLLLPRLYPIRNQNVTYTSFQRPAQITEGTRVAEFKYNANGDRVRTYFSDASDNYYSEHYLVNNEYEMWDGNDAWAKEILYLDVWKVFSLAAARLYRVASQIKIQ